MIIHTDPGRTDICYTVLPLRDDTFVTCGALSLQLRVEPLEGTAIGQTDRDALKGGGATPSEFSGQSFHCFLRWLPNRRTDREREIDRDRRQGIQNEKETRESCDFHDDAHVTCCVGGWPWGVGRPCLLRRGD